MHSKEAFRHSKAGVSVLHDCGDALLSSSFSVLSLDPRGAGYGPLRVSDSAKGGKTTRRVSSCLHSHPNISSAASSSCGLTAQVFR